MEFKGTKGKWVLIEKYDEMDTPSFSINSNESIIAHCYNLQIADGKQERAKANALLMSKSPEMLKILNWFVEYFDDLYVDASEVNDKVIETKQLIKEAIEL
jgi:hypothetical protein